MAELSELMTAIDSFLAQKGKGESYLVKKITSLFEGEEAPLDSEKGVLHEFKKKIKDLTKSVEKFSDNSKDFSKKIKTFNSVFTDNFLKNLRGFRDNLKISVLNNFFENLKTINRVLKKVQTGISFSEKESATKSQNVVDVRVISIDKTILDSLTNRLAGLFSRKLDLRVESNQEKKEEEGIISKVIKGILGTVAVFAGIGFISKFLNETEIGKSIKEKLGNFKDKALEYLKPFLKTTLELMLEGLKQVLWELPKMFLKSTFNFFSLKQLLGDENEGIAVLLTKGIYYSVKKFFLGTLNAFTFGVSGKLGTIFTNLSGKISESLFKMGSKLTATLIEPLKLFPKIPDKILQFFKFLGFGAGGGITKVLGGMSKLGGGALLKMIGTGFKAVAKRIPIIGSLISFKDAYDRFQKGDTLGGFISIGSGIATLFPGIGTAISIGLDVLNAFLDYSDSGSKFKNMINDNFIVKAVGNLVNGTIQFITDILDWLNPVSWGKDIWNWLTGEEKKVKSAIQEQKAGNPNFERKVDSTTRYDIPLKRVNDARVNGKNVIVPNSQDDVIMAKNGGPFDKAFKEMNYKLEVLASVFAEGVQVIANTSAAGSSNIVQAVAASGGNKTAPVIVNNVDPIHSFRTRAQIAIQSVR